MGDRIPAVFFHSGTTRLLICSDMEIPNQCYDSSNNLPINVFTKIEISQTQQSNGNYLFRIKVAGKVVYQRYNGKARFFSDVKVYQSDHWHRPANVEMKDFLYQNLAYGKSLL